MIRKNFLFLIFLIWPVSLFSMMQVSKSGVYPSRKAVNELMQTGDDFLLRFSAQSILKVFISDLSFAQRAWNGFIFSLQVMNSLKKGPDYHSFEVNISRGFTDNEIYGLLSIGYRLGRFDSREQWLTFSTGTGYIPSPYGIESSFAYYLPLSYQKYGRVRGDVLGLYRVGKGTTFFDLGIQTSIYVIPSGELGIPLVHGINEENSLIEEFMQAEGGIIIRYTVVASFSFEMVVTNVLYINQKNYEVPVDTDFKREYATQITYAPKVIMSFTFKL